MPIENKARFYPAFVLTGIDASFTALLQAKALIHSTDVGDA